jgi:hypothetical protein
MSEESPEMGTVIRYAPVMPASVRIMGKAFRLIEETSTSSTLAQDEFVGRVNSVKQTIVYASGQADEQRADTIVHEIIHALDYAMKLDVSEQQTHALAAGLVAVVNDNPELFRALFATLR